MEEIELENISSESMEGPAEVGECSAHQGPTSETAKVARKLGVRKRGKKRGRRSARVALKSCESKTRRRGGGLKKIVKQKTNVSLLGTPEGSKDGPEMGDKFFSSTYETVRHEPVRAALFF